jgi:pseudaminic acid cytidylyltransferase
MNSPNASLLAVIPARAGSKRLPGKNIRCFFGKPIIAYTIAAARESKLFQQIVVSTDDAEIAAVARDFGGEVPFLRESTLADDHTPVSSVSVDTLARLDSTGGRFSAVAQLMPNCPLRTADDIRDSFQQFLATDAAAQISVTRFGWQNAWWALRRSDSYELKSLFPDAHRTRSQDLPALYCPTGVIWWAKAELLRRTGTFHVPGKTGWELPWQRAVDIDTEEDWKFAEVMFELTQVRNAPIA